MEKTPCICSAVYFFPLQSLYEPWFIALYTVFYTSFPILCVSFFEQVRQFKRWMFLWTQQSYFDVWSSAHKVWIINLHPAYLCCRTWVQKAAWNGRSCTSLDREMSSPAHWCCPCRSCMPSTHRLFSSTSRSESSTTQPLTTRPWQSPSPWQPRLWPPLRSGPLFS